MGAQPSPDRPLPTPALVFSFGCCSCAFASGSALAAFALALLLLVAADGDGENCAGVAVVPDVASGGGPCPVGAAAGVPIAGFVMCPETSSVFFGVAAAAVSACSRSLAWFTASPRRKQVYMRAVGKESEIRLQTGISSVPIIVKFPKL